MSIPLITDWSAGDAAIDQLLALATRSLLVFDRDLSRLAFERPQRMAELVRLLRSGTQARAELIVQDAGPLQRTQPRLLALLSRESQRLSIIEAPAHLTGLAESLLIVDGRHALLRFHRDQPRARLLLDAPQDCARWLQRFAEIRGEGGTPLSATTLGL
ncbi:hypothetical protein [Rhodocyclus tenuis]|uniref:DUF7931 domain-containing protein n=1 Tax=Rhodocyclus tenuis TaxID=1066 RepID=UPI00190354D6|nr:hypothetical protein [Rhodocyclus tenuis]MBK1679864.1 hypothetical protein [Rhodocyclus tenuis]